MIIISCGVLTIQECEVPRPVCLTPGTLQEVLSLRFIAAILCSAIPSPTHLGSQEPHFQLPAWLVHTTTQLPWEGSAHPDPRQPLGSIVVCLPLAPSAFLSPDWSCFFVQRLGALQMLIQMGIHVSNTPFGTRGMFLFLTSLDWQNFGRLSTDFQMDYRV